MGRTEKSQGLAPPAIRKDIRAKQARHIINKVVPAILASNARARKSAENSELIVDPGPISAATSTPKEKERADDNDAKYIKRKGQGRRKAKTTPSDPPPIHAQDDISRAKGKNDSRSFLPIEPERPLKIRILTTDTLTASSTLLPRNTRTHPNPCILNMASPLHPGGGVLAGATSQEEFLCARTTLLPSLHDSFYRLPERGAVFTRDVLVFRAPRLPLGDPAGELGVSERWWVDVVSAGGLRFPDLEGPEGETRLGVKDRRLVEEKMRAVMRILQRKGVRKCVLGAWGAGAYGNPVRDVAEAWRTVLDPLPEGKKNEKKGRKAERWTGLEEVVFAISHKKMAREFADAFGGGVVVEEGPGGLEEDDGEEETDELGEELRSKIAEMEGQIEKVWNAELKQRMTVILEGLKAQLKEREGTPSNQSQDSEDESESEVEEAEEGREELDGSSDDPVDDSDVDDFDGDLKLPDRTVRPD